MSLSLHATSSLRSEGPGRGARGQLMASPLESPRTLWLYACKWLRYTGTSRRGKSSGRDSRRCRSSLLSLGVLSCRLARPAGTDSLMWMGERAGKPAIPPEHSLGAIIWLMTQPTALTGPGAVSHDGRGVYARVELIPLHRRVQC